MKIALMGADDADEASQSVQRLEHRRDERGVAAVARENLTDRGFNPADQFFGFLPFLIGHVRVPSASGWRRSKLRSATITHEKISDFRRPNIAGGVARSGDAVAPLVSREHARPCTRRRCLRRERASRISCKAPVRLRTVKARKES